MRLTGIFLYPDLVEFRSDAARSFAFQTRFICNYVQRCVAARKVQAEGFSKICVVCRTLASESSFKTSSNALIVEVPFDIADYEKTARHELPEYFLGLLEPGLIKASREQHLPVEPFQEAIETFRALCYKNQWVHSAKAFRSHGLKCRLLCELDLSSFHLMLEVKRGGELVFSQEILRTLPDEVIYAHRFKDLSLEGETLLVKDKFGRSLFELNLS
jgi:hypothetical protein